MYWYKYILIRLLNWIMEHDRPLLSIEYQIDKLKNAFSIFDLKNGFFHTKVNEGN